MKTLFTALSLTLVLAGNALADSVTAKLSMSANTATSITQTKIYGICATGTTCPALPWAGATTQTYSGAATSMSTTIPSAIIGQTCCFAATYLAGSTEGGYSNVASGTVIMAVPGGLMIDGPLTIK